MVPELSIQLQVQSFTIPSYNDLVLSGKRVRISLLIAMTVIAFILYCLPNAAASQNMAMVSMFEPDEAGPLPYALRMIAPQPNLDKTLRAFVFYEYYFYGFPYFAASAIAVLPVQLLGGIGNLSLVMLVLRQLVSVLPALLALLLLVYLQDGFNTYRSPLLFALLLFVPAVVQNNFWWHPDSLVTLLVVLTLFFLYRDNLRFGRNFLAAAVLCGVATATKLVGVYFFLAVGLTLLSGLVLKKAPLKRLLLMAAAYLAVMAVSFVAANPFLLSHWARTAYANTLNYEIGQVSTGYGVIYEKGLFTAWPTMHQYYGEALFLLAALGAVVWGIVRSPRRLLYGLILAWFLPVTFVTLFVTHFKYQYWLPAALPLISSLVLVLPERLSSDALRRFSLPRLSSLRSLARLPVLAGLARLALVLLLFAQLALFAVADANTYNARLHRADDNIRIQFYSQAVQALRPLQGQSLYVYYDYRLYVPETPGWGTMTSFDLLEYSYIQDNKFDVLLLLQQRIIDYTQAGVTGIDPAQFARARQFYLDAGAGALTGYHLVFRNPVGLVFVSDLLFGQYFN